MTRSDRKQAGTCARCPAPVIGSDMCDACEPRQLEHARRYLSQRREEYRAGRLCLDCGEVCVLVLKRCDKCLSRRAAVKRRSRRLSALQPAAPA